MPKIPFRQIHLDFHTSPHIPDVGVDFDSRVFVQTLQQAHVNSITVFSRCHHGYCYYPTKVGAQHPHLKRDLLGEMIEACHRAGIRTPVYTTVVWDEYAWETHPEWRHISPDGGYVTQGGTHLAAGWKNLCMNTGYADYVMAQIEEVLDNYDGDGMFIDILRYGRTPCVCSVCLAQMRKQDINITDPQQLYAFALDVERQFMTRCSAAIRAKKVDHPIFYNSRLRLAADPELGNRYEMDDFTHIEIESLPGGFWGYDHFPLYVRYFLNLGKPLLAMNGRFHTMWGDFGGLRNRAALEFECFQALAHGAACSIGDQLLPRGALEPAVYERIGEVFAQVEQREPWCIDTEPLPDIGVFIANNSSVRSETDINPCDRGALHVLEQLKHQFALLDAEDDLSPYKLLILPDEVPLDELLAARLRAYLKDGGKLLISGVSGLHPRLGDYLLSAEMGVHYAGPAPFVPDYLILEDALIEGIEPMNHVVEKQGVQITVDSDVEVLAWSGHPYFNRTGEHFCSHQYTPFSHKSDDPVIVQKENIIFIARPLFSEYAETANRVHRQVIANCIKRLLPDPRVAQHNLPSTAIVTVRRKNNDVLVHVLHYIHQRRGRNLDVIEDVISLYNVHFAIRIDREPDAVRLVPEEQAIEWTWSDDVISFIVPKVNGYQIIKIEGTI